MLMQVELKKDKLISSDAAINGSRYWISDEFLILKWIFPEFGKYLNVKESISKRFFYFASNALGLEIALLQDIPENSFTKIGIVI